MKNKILSLPLAFCLVLGCVIFWPGITRANSPESESVILYNSSQNASDHTLHAIFKNIGTSDTSVLLDLELYNSNNQKIAQTFRNNITLGQASEYTFDLAAQQILGQLQSGTYTWKAGIFSPNWTSLVHWYNNVLNFTVATGTPTNPNDQNNQQHNGNIAIVTVDQPKEPLHVGQTASIGVRLISGNGENANNVDVHIQLLKTSGEIAAEQVSRSQTILHEQSMLYTLSIPTTLSAGDYKIKVVVYNQDGNINVSFDKIGTIVVV